MFLCMTVESFFVAGGMDIFMKKGRVIRFTAYKTRSRRHVDHIRFRLIKGFWQKRVDGLRFIGKPRNDLLTYRQGRRR